MAVGSEARYLRAWRSALTRWLGLAVAFLNVVGGDPKFWVVNIKNETR
jgi:hypothetical protein